MAALVITATPKFTEASTFNEERYLKKWDNKKVTIKRVDILPSGSSEGSVLVVMTSDELKKVAGEDAVISDIFAPRKPNSSKTSQEWAAMQYTKAIEALDSAGETASMTATFEDGKEKEFLKEVIKPLLSSIVGKEVFISQYFKNKDDDLPKVKYKRAKQQ